MRSLRLALSLLTVVPVRSGEAEPATARNAMLLAPLAGLLAAAPGAVLLAVFDRPPLVVAALAVGSLAALTGALHWDGLADTADGLAVPRGRRDPLAVMRQSDLGPTGALAIGVALILQVTSLAALRSGADAVGAWLVAVCAGRAALALVCVRGTSAARPDGLGALVVGTVPRALALVPAVLVAVAAAAVSTPARGVSALVAVVVVAWLVRDAAGRRLGGLTGDVLGAIVETSTATCLVALSLQW